MALFEDDIEIKPRPLGVPVTEPVIVLNPLLLPFSPLCHSKRQFELLLQATICASRTATPNRANLVYASLVNTR
jgi:hypothetical protein